MISRKKIFYSPVVTIRTVRYNTKKSTNPHFFMLSNYSLFINKQPLTCTTETDWFLLQARGVLCEVRTEYQVELIVSKR